MKTIIVIAIVALSFHYLYCEELQYFDFNGPILPVNPKIEKFLLEQNYLPMVWNYDKQNKASIPQIFPNIKLAENLFVFNVATLFLDDEKYNYLVVLKSEPEPKVVDTIGPFYDSFITGIAYKDINGDDLSEIIIRYVGEFYRAISIYTFLQEKFIKIYNKESDTFPRLVDLNDDNIYEIMIDDIMGADSAGEGWMFKETPPIWNDIYEYSNGRYIKCNEKYKFILLENIPGYKATLDSLSVINNADVGEFSNIRLLFIDLLKEWIDNLENL